MHLSMINKLQYAHISCKVQFYFVHRQCDEHRNNLYITSWHIILAVYFKTTQSWAIGTESKTKETPLMRQYFKIKAKYPDAILLFRVGDFYETFGDDAIKTSNALGVVLTRRNNGGNDIELAGFPYHSLDLYLPKLVQAGFRVAICEQLEKPGKEKKIVKRGVTEMVTPGVTSDDTLLNHRQNNYLAALHSAGRDHFGIAFLDVSTGEFLVSEGTAYQIEKLIQSFEPAEIIFSKSRKQDFEKQFGNRYYTYPLDEWVFSFDFAREKLLDHFQVVNLKGFSIEELTEGQVAAGACLQYLNSTEHGQISHINSIARIHPDESMWMDRFTIRNLELITPAFSTGKALIDIMDETVTPMGSRLLKKWLLLPLISRSAIQNRLDIVAFWIDHEDIMDEVISTIRQIGDLERLIGKVSMGKINPREIGQLRRSLFLIEPLINVLNACDEEQLGKLADNLNACPTLRSKLERALVDEPPTSLHKGNVIRSGYHEELDDLRDTIHNSKELLLQIQQSEAERTGITNLKIGFNNVFGYYLEVTNKYKNQGLVPDTWIRKQTLTNSERYVTDELKKLEQKILGAEEKIAELEEKLYIVLVEEVHDFIPPIQQNAYALAQIDCLIAFAVIARKNRYCRPRIDESKVIDIKEGRHPVIERHLPLGEEYVPNDCYLDNEVQQILMITGPNMSGKSALLRQTALITIMAQMGSYVPAYSASIGLIDKLFTRVGASDNISSGESTFMVEMTETASIMNNLSDRSLILLDEIGRGTSTYDGISIAWSVAEYLHDNPEARAKTLFATHYHELNALSESHPRIRNFHISTKEVGNKVIFLRKLVPGGSEHSFGIHVAKMAGMPLSIVARSTEILYQLESKAIESVEGESGPQVTPKGEITPTPLQLSIFESFDPTAGKLREMLQDLDVNRMTPVECMMKLLEMQKELEVDED